jgi:hypothetical protein
MGCLILEVGFILMSAVDVSSACHQAKPERLIEGFSFLPSTRRRYSHGEETLVLERLSSSHDDWGRVRGIGRGTSDSSIAELDQCQTSTLLCRTEGVAK